MSVLTVGRLSATVHAVDDRPVDRMLHRLADTGLEAALADTALPPGDWCVRRVQTVVRWDAGRHESDVEHDWAHAVLSSLRAVIDGGGTHAADVVHYRGAADALADVIASLAVRRPDREWAWRQLGLRVAGDPDPGTDPAGAASAAAGRRPHAVSAALVAALHTVGAPALHRLLAGPGWPRLAAIVAAAHGCADGDVRRLLAPAAGPSAGPAVPGPEDDRARDRARAALRAAELAGALDRAGLRPDPATTRAWAVLALAATDPGGLPAPSAAGVVAALAGLLAGAPEQRRPRGLVVGARASGTRSGSAAAAGRTGNEPAADPGEATRADARPTGARPTDAQPVAARPTGARPPVGTERTAAPEAPEEPSGRSSDVPGLISDRAGLLFLLATAAPAGVPDRLHDEVALAARPLRWTLHRLGLLLAPGAAADDPAVLALAGLPPSADPPDGPDPTGPERAALAAAADRWRTVTVDRLGPGDEPVPVVVARVVDRRGEIVADPGWIEVAFALADVDLDVRRAGLDLDPGWVPWLGAVVRFRYVDALGGGS